MKLTCIILLYIDIQYQFCCACECSFISEEHCSFSFHFLSGKERFSCDEKCNCINVVVNFLRSAIFFYLFFFFLPPLVVVVNVFLLFSLYVLTGTFLDLMWYKLRVWFVETYQEF